MVFFNKVINLNSEEISKGAKETTDAYINSAGKKAFSDQLFSFAIEEILLRCRAAYGENAEVNLELGKLFGRIYIEVKHKGENLNPFSRVNDDEMSPYIYSYFKTLNIAPEYKYSHKSVNILRFSVAKKVVKNKSLYTMLGAIALAVLCYFVLGLFGASTNSLAATDFTKPIFTKITQIITTLATPLVFLSVMTGIVGIGDVATLGTMGKKTFFEGIKSYILAGALLGVLGGITYFSVASKVTESKDYVKQIVTLVLDIIPSNIFKPFVEDNALQVISISVFFGIVLLLMSKKLDIIPKLCQEFSEFFNTVMIYACKLIPFMVFLGIYNILADNNLTKLLSVYKMVLLFVVISLIIVVAVILHTWSVLKVSPLKLLKTQAKYLTILISTSSQVTAIQESMEVLKNKFGIDKRLADFALPVYIVVYMPCGAVMLGLIVLSLGNIAGVSITVDVIVKVVIVCIVIAIAAPPIPGSALVVMPIVFGACGVPMSQYPVAVVIGTIVGYFLPFLNGYLVHLKLLIVAKKLDILDMNMLKECVKK